MSHARLVECYSLLEVPDGADEATIKKSYRSLVLKYHPDKNPKDPAAAQIKIRAINAAYELLRNSTRCQSLESQAVAVNTVRFRPSHWKVDHESCSRLRDVVLPEPFLVSPMGLPDKFLRSQKNSCGFQSREDLTNTSFDDFFVDAGFIMTWMADANNADRLPKLGCPCKLMPSPRATPNYLAGAASFGLSPGVRTSDVMISQIGRQSDAYCYTLFLMPSPTYSGAFRFEAAYFPGHFLAFDPPNRVIMTGDVDPFTVIDFMLSDTFNIIVYMTIEEVLTPALIALGGDRGPVKLTAVCQNPTVISYFKKTIGDRMWDFSDFELYFHAHDDVFAYDPQQQTLRLRSEQERKERLIPSLKRELVDGSVASQHTNPKQAKSASLKGPPTKVVLLCNLVGVGEIDEELEEEVAEEARRYGELKSCTLKELSKLPHDQAIRIYLEYTTLEGAEKAAADFNGRLFDGRLVRAHYYDENRFRNGHLDDKLEP